MTFEIIHVAMLTGKGRKRVDFNDIEKCLKDKQSIVQIRNKDDLYCARSIVTAKTRLDNHPQSFMPDRKQKRSCTSIGMTTTMTSSRPWHDSGRNVTIVLFATRDTITSRLMLVIMHAIAIAVKRCTKSTKKRNGSTVLDATVILRERKQTAGGYSTCNTYYTCKTCSQTINTLLHKHDHQCGEKYCKTCKNYVEVGHQCYMVP